MYLCLVVESFNALSLSVTSIVIDRAAITVTANAVVASINVVVSVPIVTSFCSEASDRVFVSHRIFFCSRRFFLIVVYVIVTVIITVVITVVVVTIVVDEVVFLFFACCRMEKRNFNRSKRFSNDLQNVEGIVIRIRRPGGSEGEQRCKLLRFLFGMICLVGSPSDRYS